MGTSDRWEHGVVVTLQEVWHGRLWTARPVRVVVDSEELIALWCPSGTPIKGPSAPWRPGRDAGPEYFIEMFTEQDWLFADYTWPTDNLMLLVPGRWYSVWVSWTPAAKNWGWYINFQLPFTRTSKAIQTMDLMLDLVVDQDRAWRWKDEDEFEALVSTGIIHAMEASRVREAAQDVLRDICDGSGAFGEPWHNRRADLSWSMPEVPPNRSAT